MRHVPLDAVEFIGGPLDGLLRFVDGSVDQLERFVATPMNYMVAQMLDGRLTTTKAPVTSIAIYQLQAASRNPHYTFLGSVARKIACHTS